MIKVHQALGGGGAATHAADVFSLGALHFELVVGRRWLDIPDHRQTVGEYRSALSRAGSTSSASGSNGSNGVAETEAAAVVKYMTAATAATRPGAAALGTAAYFKADPGMTALRSLDSFLELDVLGRAAFLQSLKGGWELFDARVLR